MSSKQNDNNCSQCGGILRIEYTISFERILPAEIRVTSLPDGYKLCPGHDVEPETRTVQGGTCWACGKPGTDMRWWHAGIYGDDGELLHNERLSFLIHKDSVCYWLAVEKISGGSEVD